MRLTLRQSVQIPSSAHDVFAYVSDFNRATDWRTEVRISTQSPPGPMTKDSRLHEESVIMGRRVVTDSVVDRFEPGRRFTFTHTAGPIPVSGEYLVVSSPDGSGSAELTYTLHAELRGLWALAAPYLKWAGRRTIATSLTNLRAQLTPR